MATIRVDISQIEDHLAQQDSINVTSFNWSQHSRIPDIEWEIDSDVGDLEYDDDDYVDIEELNKLQENYEQLDRSYDELTAQYNVAQQQILLLEQQVDALTAVINANKKPFWKFW